eukprot:1154177-Pelagomonas_calceolata.AAC.3
MHVLGHVYQQFLDWARSLWQSGRGPALQLSQDSLEGVFGEAIASPTEALQLLVQQLVSNTTTGIQFARCEAYTPGGGSDRHAAHLHTFPTLAFLNLHMAGKQNMTSLLLACMEQSDRVLANALLQACLEVQIVALLSSDEGDTFGVTALHGRGSEHFPAVLRSNETAWPDGKRRAQLQRFTLSPKQVFLTSDSNWAVADVHSANMEMPCFYECLSSARGEVSSTSMGMEGQDPRGAWASLSHNRQGRQLAHFTPPKTSPNRAGRMLV